MEAKINETGITVSVTWSELAELAEIIQDILGEIDQEDFTAMLTDLLESSD